MRTITLIIFASFFSSTLLSDDFKDKMLEYDKLFLQISQKRTGIANEEIDRVQNPFIMSYTKEVIKGESKTVPIKKVNYSLSVILNKKAKINGKWYKLDSVIGDFKLSKIKSSSVVLKNKNFKKEILIKGSNIGKINFSSK